MSEKIIHGPKDRNSLPHSSLGIIFHKKLLEKNPDDLILANGNSHKSTTCRQFKKTVNTLARKLHQLGIQRNDVVAIISENRSEYFAIVLACFYVGATANLLNFSYTSDEFSRLFEICRPKLIFCSKTPLSNILSVKSFLATIILIDNEDKAGVSQTLHQLLEDKSGDEEDFVPVEVDPENDVALIVTSSGTTGFPKAVMLTHANFRITLLCFSEAGEMELNKTTKTIAYLPFFHIMGISWSLSAILQSSKLILLEKFEPNIFLSTIEKYEINTLFAVPPIIIFLIKNPLAKQFNLSSLTRIFSGGASLADSTEVALKQAFPNIKVSETYGMTEIGGPITSMMADKQTSKHSIGRPTSTVDLAVCDQKDNFWDVHEVGELRVRGRGIMKGYCGNELATSLAFDRNGFLKTGDLGYYDRDGFFYVNGRLKEIIKYKGFQVSPVELESLLIKHEGIADVAVAGIPDEYAGELTTAFVVRDKASDFVTAEEIKRYVSENVCTMKQLHGGVWFVDKIPKNASGKILRNKLKRLMRIKSNL